MAELGLCRGCGECRGFSSSTLFAKIHWVWIIRAKSVMRHKYALDGNIAILRKGIVKELTKRMFWVVLGIECVMRLIPTP